VKLTIPTSELLAQLHTVSRVASTRSAVQALAGVMLSASEDGHVELLATDMEIGLRVPLQAELARPGAVVLPARLLLDVVRSLPAEQLTLELRTTEQDVELKSGAATFHLRTFRTEDFPTLPTPSGETRLTLPGEALTQTISRVAGGGGGGGARPGRTGGGVSASRDETRPVLTGVLMSASGQELRMVATDSYRLSVKQTALDAPLAGSLEANVPARAMQELVRIAQQLSTDSVAVSVGQNQVVFELGDVVLSSRLIDGQFPNYRQLLPESVEHELRLSTAELGEVVRRISLLAQKNAPLRLSFSEGTLTVSARTPDIGEASESIPVPFHGETFEIGFNPEFLRDGLESVESEELVLKLISPLRPGLIEAPEGDEFVYLIMPIRLNV
jgi:DNA polymerase-3 subunit beta